MKRTRLILSAIVSGAVLASCGGEAKTENHEEAAHSEQMVDEQAAPQETGAATWAIDTEGSKIKWTGGTSGAQVYSHYGTIGIKEGKFMTEGQELTGGSIIIDMTAISPEDEGYSEEHPASDLVGHLSSPDFFDVENNPTATFTIKSVEGMTVTGDLTVRGITHEESLNLEVMDVAPEHAHLRGMLEFDRQKYDVAWEHYLKDVVLSDMIALEFEINGNK